MNFLQNEIRCLVSNIWDSVLNLEIREQDEQDPASDEGNFITGIIQIDGAWRGVVTLVYPCSLATKVASRMFEVPLDEVTLEDMRDAMAEMVNMTGGNIKGELPTPTNLSLPTVGEGHDYTMVVSGSQLLNRLSFICDAETVWVSVYEAPKKNSLREGRVRGTDVSAEV